MRRIEISGHRGARGLWPENTLAGFAGARAIGVDAVECDVMLAGDGQVVVTHDATLDPDIARGPDGAWIAPPGPAVRSLAVPALHGFDVGRLRPGSRLASAFARQQPVDGARIPLLAETLAVLAGSGILLDVELKSEATDPDHLVDRLAQAVLALAEGWPDQPIAVRSFDWRGLAAMRRRRPGLRLGFLTETGDAAALRAVGAQARPGDTWAPGHAGLAAALVAAARAAGLRVEPWTANDPSDMRRLAVAGVDGLCTDYPDLARLVLLGKP